MSDYTERLDAEFKNFVAKVYPGVSETQVMELRRTFYAGAWTVCLDISVHPEIFADAMKAAHDECQRFYDMAQKDIETMQGRKIN